MPDFTHQFFCKPWKWTRQIEEIPWASKSTTIKNVCRGLKTQYIYITTQNWRVPNATLLQLYTVHRNKNNPDNEESFNWNCSSSPCLWTLPKERWGQQDLQFRSTTHFARPRIWQTIGHELQGPKRYQREEEHYLKIIWLKHVSWNILIFDYRN